MDAPVNQVISSVVLPGDLTLQVGKFYANRSGSVVKVHRTIPEDDVRYHAGYRFIGKLLTSGQCAEYLPNGRVYTTSAQHLMDIVLEVEDYSPILLYGLKEFGRAVFEIIAVTEDEIHLPDLHKRISEKVGRRIGLSQTRNALCSLIMRKLVHSEPIPPEQRSSKTDLVLLRRSHSAKQMAYQLNLL